jgi:hypothetical protein
LKKEIIDNQKDNYTMSQFLNDQLNHNGNTGEMEVSTGYFNISGYKLLSKSLWRFSKTSKFRLRLLFGKEAIRQNSCKFVRLLKKLVGPCEFRVISDCAHQDETALLAVDYYRYHIIKS